MNKYRLRVEHDIKFDCNWYYIEKRIFFTWFRVGPLCSSEAEARGIIKKMEEGPKEDKYIYID